MAIWRSTELEVLFGGPLDSDGITESSITSLVTNAISESEILEFKRQLREDRNSTSTIWSAEQEFAKDVALFANARGGVILFGVVESHGVASALSAMVVSDVENEERGLRQVLRNYLSPFVNVEFVWITSASGGYFLALVIPPSHSAPHGVSQPRGESRIAYCYPVRHGADTIWLSEFEVADRYRRRFDGLAEERLRVSMIVTQGIRALRSAAGIWHFVALVPELAREERLDSRFIVDSERWFNENRPHYFPNDITIRAFGRGVAAPGRVTFSGSIRSISESEADVREAYVELHVDGSGFAALPICPQQVDDARRVSVFEDTLLEYNYLMTELLVNWCVHRVGTWGVATMIVGLAEPSQTDFALSEPLSLVNVVRNDRIDRVEATRSVVGNPQFETTIDLSSVNTSQNRLVVTHLATSGLLQFFGRAEPRGVTADGKIILRQFPATYRRMIQEWCAQRSIETIEIA